MSKIIISILLFSFSSGTYSHQWTKIKEIDQITVYSSISETSFDAIWITAVVNCSLKEFVAFINNADNYKEWVYSCSDSNKLRKDRNVLYYETVTDMPFPVADRYLQVKSTQDLQEKSWTSHSVAVSGFEHEGAVSINNFDSKWNVNVVGPQKIHIDYVIETEPGGYIPPWMYNLAVDIGPYNTMKNLKTTLEKSSNQ